MSKRDYYQILGVPKSSTESEIKKSYRKLAIKHHPDKNPGDKAAEESFKEISEAYQVLSNKDKRQKYDTYGHEGMDRPSGGGFGGGMNMDDIFSQFGDVFGQQFNSQKQKRNVRKGKSLRVEIGLTPRDIVNGVNKKIAINRDVKCNSCSGNGSKNGKNTNTCHQCSGYGTINRRVRTPIGFIEQSHTCVTCNGAGNIIKENCDKCFGLGILKNQREEVDINIPRGARQGMEFAVRNKGSFPAYGGVCGDLLVNIFEKNEENYMFEGSNIICDLKISFADANQGKKDLEIKTPHGKAKIKIPENCHQGQALRLKGKGFPLYNSNEIGDMILYVNFDIPKGLIEKLKKLDILLYEDCLKNNENNENNENKGIYKTFRKHFSR